MSDNLLAPLTTKQQKLFELLEQSAIAGERCPSNDQLQILGFPPSGATALSELARCRVIKVAIYALNYRVVTIMYGEHTGKTTTLPPSSGSPHRIIYGNQDSGKKRQTQTRAPVSLPPLPDWLK